MQVNVCGREVSLTSYWQVHPSQVPPVATASWCPGEDYDKAFPSVAKILFLLTQLKIFSYWLNWKCLRCWGGCLSLFFIFCTIVAHFLRSSLTGNGYTKIMSVHKLFLRFKRKTQIKVSFRNFKLCGNLAYHVFLSILMLKFYSFLYHWNLYLNHVTALARVLEVCKGHPDLFWIPHFTVRNIRCK